MRCEKCVAEEAAKKTTWRHRLKCEKWFETSILGEDYVKCALCEFRARQLTQHTKREHGFTKKEYIEKFGPISCSAASKVRSQTNKVNGNWFGRASDERREEWRQGLGEKISAGIMSSPSARVARRQNMTKRNQSEEGRKLSSETAIRTSARPDIQKKRAAALQKWRDENREEFYEKCTRAMHRTWQSVPECRLFELLIDRFPEHGFKQNQQIRRTGKFRTVKSGTRQIDIYSRDHKVVVEFDGIYHFEPVRGADHLSHIQAKDQELGEVLSAEGFLVIRVSYDQFDYKQGGYFHANCVQHMVKLVSKGEPGLHLIGESYENS